MGTERIIQRKDGGKMKCLEKTTDFNLSVAHVVFASDDQFAEILGVSLISLFENSKDMEEINVYVLDTNILEENKRKLTSICNTYDRNIIFIPATDISKKMSMKIEMDRGSLSQYARLFVSTDLPENIDRVLYLDCDVIVKESIKELWNLDLHGKTIGALMDAFSKYYRKNIDLQSDDIMFNSGVMLIDLKRWKEQKIEEKLIAFIKSKKGKIQQGDQGALNAVLSRDTYCFEPRFNSVTIFYDFTYEEMLQYRRPPVFYNKEEIKEAVENPSIIHFTTSFLSKRAWVEGCEHRYVNEWLKYKKLSPWEEKKLWPDGRPRWQTRFFNALPRKLAIVTAAFFQVYGRPLRNRVRQIM